ncbi:hypothetical protein [Tessaracoccus sp. G1721]
MVRSIIVVTAALSLAVSGCGADATPTGTPAAASPSSPVAAPTGPASSVAQPQLNGEAVAATLTAAGFDAGTAAFAQHAAATLEAPDPHTFVVRQTYPTGAVATTAYHLHAGAAPAEPTMTVDLTDGDLRYTLEYTVDAATLPADLRAQVTAGLPGAAPSDEDRAAVLGALLRAPMEEGPSTISVVADGVISQAQETAVDSMGELTRLDKTLAGTSWEAYKSGKKVTDALKTNALVSTALARVAAARKCAANPTNELTKKAFAEDPAAQKELLRQLDEAADEITGSAAVMFVQMATDAGAGLLTTAPWLGFITSPATNYVSETLTGSINERLRAAEQLVPACTKTTYRVTGGSGVTVNATVESMTAPFEVNGAGDGFRLIFSFQPGDDTGKFGLVTYEGGGSGVTMSGSGSYTVAGADPGPYTLTMTTQGCVDGGTCATNTDKLKFTPQTG